MIKKHFIYFSLIAILAVLISSISPAAVYADGGTTSPPTESTDPKDNPAGETPPSSNPGTGSDTTPPASDLEKDKVDSSSAPNPGTNPQITTSNSDASGGNKNSANGHDAPTKDSPKDASILAQLPANTTIVVVNSDGQTELLVTQQAADAISGGDPIWCPATQSPTPGLNGCTSSYDNIEDLLNFLLSNQGNDPYKQPGAIYFGAGNYTGSGSNIDFNNYSFNDLTNYDLTIQGGWDTASNTVDPASSTIFDVSLTIGNSTNPWVGSLTINNIQIQDLFGEDALTVYSQNDVTLSNVEITNIQNGTAATLSSTNGNVKVIDSKFNNSGAGAEIVAGGNVDVTDSTFNDNGQGLKATSGAVVTLANIEANHNEQFGADVNAVGSVSVNSSFFNGNQAYVSDCNGSTYEGYGLKVVSLDSIALNEVTTTDNNQFGAYLDAANDVNIANSVFSNNGSASTEEIDGRGLEVKSGGYVNLYNVEANNNREFGADITAANSVAVSLGFFSGHQAITTNCGEDTYYGYGLKIVTLDTVALDQVTASENYLYGASVDAGSNVAISNSIFNNNVSPTPHFIDDTGLLVRSGGTVSLSSVEASYNRLLGANIEAVGSVAIKNSTFSGNQGYTDFNGVITYYGYGLKVVTQDSISLDGVTASDNYLYGTKLDSATDIAISDSTFSNNGTVSTEELDGEGLAITSGGFVNLYNVEASGNKHFGASINAANSVSIASSFFSGNQSYTVSSNGEEYNGFGLKVISLNSIYLDDVTASDNYQYGAQLNAATEAVVTNSVFNNNGDESTVDVQGQGLDITSGSYVTLDNVEASNNRVLGATVSATGIATITNSLFTGNKAYVPTNSSQQYYGYGLKVVSLDTISLDGVTASDNYLFGTTLDATNGIEVLNSNFNLNGTNPPNISDAQGNGLRIYSGGFVTLNNVVANGNTDNGAKIDASGLVNVTNSTFNDNQIYSGLRIRALSDVTLDNVTATNNGLDGAYVTSACNTVYLIGGTYTDNANYGIRILDSFLNDNGLATFVNNGSGNIFTDPGTCN